MLSFPRDVLWRPPSSGSCQLAFQTLCWSSRLHRWVLCQSAFFFLCRLQTLPAAPGWTLTPPLIKIRSIFHSQNRGSSSRASPTVARGGQKSHSYSWLCGSPTNKNEGSLRCWGIFCLFRFKRHLKDFFELSPSVSYCAFHIHANVITLQQVSVQTGDEWQEQPT